MKILSILETNSRNTSSRIDDEVIIARIPLSITASNELDSKELISRTSILISVNIIKKQHTENDYLSN